MTTVLTYDLLLDEEITNGTELTKETTSMLSVVQCEILEIEIKNNKGENEKREIKSLKMKDSFFRNQNVNFQSENPENDNSEIKSLYLQKVERDMVKGYIKLLSNFQN